MSYNKNIILNLIWDVLWQQDNPPDTENKATQTTMHKMEQSPQIHLRLNYFLSTPIYGKEAMLPYCDVIYKYGNSAPVHRSYASDFLGLSTEITSVVLGDRQGYLTLYEKRTLGNRELTNSELPKLLVS